jgi:CheY-like chemotaxis protein
MPEHAIEADPSKGIFLVDGPSNRAHPAEPAAERATQDSGAVGGTSGTQVGAEAGAESANGSDADNQRDPFREMLSELFEGVEDAEQSGPRKEPVVGGWPDLPEVADAPAGPAYSVYRPEQNRPIPTVKLSETEGTHPIIGPEEGELERLEIGGMVQNLLKPPAMDGEVIPDSGAIGPKEPSPHLDEEGGKQQRRVRPQDFSVLMIAGDPRTTERIVKSLTEYRLEEAGDGVSGLAKLISYKPDLVVLDIDLRTVDGFEMLKHIRANLDVPIIALSSSRLRASDRIRSAELGADYYLTKPFSTRELKQKARQLIARYRQIDEWITGSAPEAPASAGRRITDAPTRGERRGLPASGPGAPESSREVPATPAAFTERILESRQIRSGQASGESDADQARMLPYAEFVRRIEEMVEATMEGDAWFSVVGCRVNYNSDSQATAGAGSLAQLVPDLIRNCDLASVNQSGDLMILLTDADATGAKAFTARLHETVRNKFKTDPVVWVRTFPFSDTQGE